MLLYKFSERRLKKLACIKEFKEIMKKHFQICDFENLNIRESLFYNKILKVFNLSPRDE